MTVNLARYKPTGEHVAVRRIALESCTNEMVAFLQVCPSAPPSHPHRLLLHDITPSSNPCAPLFRVTETHMCVHLSYFHVSCLFPPFTVNNVKLNCNTVVSSSSSCCLLQGELLVSKLFHHPSILPYRSIFIAQNELWIINPFMAYGKDWTNLTLNGFSQINQ